mgnify:CR=1 FL=1
MKSTFTCLLLASSFVVAGQTKQDYVRIVDKFVNLYNSRQTDSICTLFPDEKTTGIRCEWKGSDTDGTYDIYGNIIAHEYYDVDSDNRRMVMLFKLKFSKKGDVLLKAKLDTNHKFTIFLLEPFR